MKQTTVLRTYGLKALPLSAVRKIADLKSKDLNTLFGGLSRGTQRRISNQGVGIEVEVEAAEAHSPTGWKIEADNSLRNNGIEYKTVFGTRYHDLPEYLNSLFAQFQTKRKNSGNRYYDFSERTSIHVHLDVRSCTTDEIVSLLTLYTVFEDALFEFAGPLRKDNVFCVPLRYTRMNMETMDYLHTLTENWSKYTAINIIPMTNFGTIEFRHMEGNDNYERVMTWVTLLSLLLEFVKSNTREEITEMINLLKLSSHYAQFAEEVFGPFSRFIKTIDDLDRAVSDAKMFFSAVAVEPEGSDRYEPPRDVVEEIIEFDDADGNEPQVDLPHLDINEIIQRQGEQAGRFQAIQRQVRQRRNG